jgi:ribosome-associated translation inhibitor RaiA
MRQSIGIHHRAGDSDLAVSTHGYVAPGEVRYAREKIASALASTGRPILFVRARLEVQSDPAVAKPATVHVTVDARGRLVQVSGSGATMREAIDLTHDRLQKRLRRTAAHWQAIRGRQPSSEPNEWRHAQDRIAPPTES